MYYVLGRKVEAEKEFLGEKLMDRYSPFLSKLSSSLKGNHCLKRKSSFAAAAVHQ